MKRALPFVIIVAVLVAALLTVWYLTRPTVDRPATLPASNSSTAPSGASPSAMAPVAREPGADPPHALGPSAAPVTLEEFGDFECPPCRVLHPVLKTMHAEFGPRLRIIFRELPLVPTHEHALAAARAAEAAALQGKFWEMHGQLYENQIIWEDAFDVRPIFEGYATKIGLKLDQFKRDINSPIVEQRIFLDGKRAHALGVKGTPTVFLNGRELPFESLAPAKLRALINNELSAPRP